MTLVTKITSSETNSRNISSDYRITRKGRVLHSIKETYIRYDLGYGYTTASTSTTKSSLSLNKDEEDSTTKQLKTIEELRNILKKHKKQKSYDVLICTSSFLLYNLDVLDYYSQQNNNNNDEENEDVLCNIIIPQSSLEICKNKRILCYNRIMELFFSDNNKGNNRNIIFLPDVFHGEILDILSTSPSSTTNNNQNDNNDKKCHAIGEWLSNKIIKNEEEYYDDKIVNIIVLSAMPTTISTNTNQKTYKIKSTMEYIKELQLLDSNLSNLLDVVSQFTLPTTDTATTASSNEEKVYHKEHLPLKDVLLGIRNETYYQGTIRVNKNHKITKKKDNNNNSVDDDYTHCYVSIYRNNTNDGDKERILVTIDGTDDINRAVDGDIVAIQINPTDQWISINNEVNDDEKKSNNNNDSNVVSLAKETGESTISQEENVQDYIPQIMKKPTGKVIGIIRRNFRQNYCGSILSSSTSNNNSDDELLSLDDNNSLFLPVDTRIPPIIIRTTSNHIDRFINKRILVAIDSWPNTSAYPLGHYVRTLGNIDDKNVETEVILHEHNITTDDFSTQVLACLPPDNFCVSLENSPNRKDLRHLPILSIDPPGCKDIDDALHCVSLPNGNYQIGVHIADVTHYVKPNTPIDIEASNRSTSTYLVNKRLDMLPSLLTTNLCSLKPNVDRYAFSVLWEVTEEARIVNVQFEKTIIHSIAGLTYQQAQVYIDTPDNDDAHEDNPAINAVKSLAKLSSLFRKRRIEAGALTLASPEVKFTLDDSESLNPTDVQSYTLYQSNALVEEFMLLANVTVSKKILRHYPTLCILRRHPSPNRTAFDSLISKAATKNVQITIDTSKHLADSLDNAQRMYPNDPYFHTLLRILSTRCMSPAQYFCSGQYANATDWHHYGLAAPVYTHFTSPIRRYADILVHRLLAASISVDPLPTKMSSKDYLHNVCRHINQKHRAAQLAGRGSVFLHTITFFSNLLLKNNKFVIEDAYVLDVNTETMVLTVMVPKYGIEGKVQLNQYTKNNSNNGDLVPVTNPNWIIDPIQHKIGWKNKLIQSNKEEENNTSFVQVLNKIKVKITVSKNDDNVRGNRNCELVLTLVEPSLVIDSTDISDNKDDDDNTKKEIKENRKKKRKL